MLDQEEIRENDRLRTERQSLLSETFSILLVRAIHETELLEVLKKLTDKGVPEAKRTIVVSALKTKLVTHSLF